jgi:peptidoglycan/LPS O-acetylase OafA/YrhL
MERHKRRFHRVINYFCMNSHNERLHGLYHLRAAAIVLVLLFHYNFYYGVPEWLDTFSTFSHAWSLCVEEHFYLLLPILLYFIFTRKKLHMAIYFFKC